MNFPRIKSALVLLATWMAVAASAQSYPTKPVKIIHPFGVGSGSDQIARIVATELQASLKQPFVVEPKPGAAGFVAAQEVMKAAPDGYTLFMTPSTVLAANPSLFKKLPYDSLKDFAPIGLICTVPTLLVVDANLPIRNVQELLAYARSKGHISYGYGSSTAQIGGAALANLHKINATGVGYKSSTLALTDVAGGHLAFMFIDIGASQALVQAGKIRQIAVANEERSALVPDLPTMASTPGMAGFELTGWASMTGPAGLPAEVVTRINTEMNKILRRKDINDKLLGIGCEVSTTSPEQFTSYIQKQIVSYGEKVRAAGVQPQ